MSLVDFNTVNPIDMGGNGIGGNGFSSLSTEFSFSQDEFEQLIKELIK